MSDIELSSETTTSGRRGRGRPKKDSSQIQNNTNNGGLDAIKNGTNTGRDGKKRGRKPNDTSKSGPSNAKRGRGRPPKKATNAAKKGNKGRRGRPKKSESVEEEAAPIDEDASASAEEEDEDD